MGNQQSSSPGAPGHVSSRPRRDSEGPAHLPPGATCHVSGARERRHSGTRETRDKTGPLDTVSLASRLRKLSGGDPGDRTPGTFETPPMITVRPQRRVGVVTGPDNVLGMPGPLVPMSERYLPELTSPGVEREEARSGPRPRARTINHAMIGAAWTATKTSRTSQVPTVFKYSKSPNADDVYVTGSMTDWHCVKMSKPPGEAAWVHIIDTREGKHFYKFLVDGHWVVEETEAKVEREDKVWNVIEVKRSDFEVFDALACDSFSVRNSEKTKSEKNFSSDSWCQVSPNFDKLDIKMKTPPTLPPHLLQVILNKDVSYQPDPILLEEPSHVMLNHIYAQAIRDDLLVLSSTQRFKKKYVTTLLYKPIE